MNLSPGANDINANIITVHEVATQQTQLQERNLSQQKQVSLVFLLNLH